MSAIYPIAVSCQLSRRSLTYIVFYG